MGYKVKVNNEITWLDSDEIPGNQKVLKEQLRKHYPGCYIKSIGCSAYVPFPEETRLNNAGQGYGVHPIRLFASSKGAWSPSSAIEEDLSLWHDDEGQKYMTMVLHLKLSRGRTQICLRFSPAKMLLFKSRCQRPWDQPCTFLSQMT